MSPSWPALALIAVVAMQRLVELAIARHNTTRLLAQGGREVGANHYPLIVALHAAWLAALLVFGWQNQMSLPFVAIYVLLQLFRVWVLLSLGDRWTTRIIVLDAPPVRRGPYRFVAHPNYLLVAAEIAAVPLALNLLVVALVFTLLNAAAMAIRIPVEQAALTASRHP